MVAYGLFGIDEIAVEIEDPFGDDANDLPLDEIVDEINRCITFTMRPVAAEGEENVL